jgi:CRP-like cAMP-binding protein
MMLERGRAEVLEDGEPIDVLGPGDCFGELAVLSDGQPRTASVVASGEVHAIVLSAHFMRELHDLLPDVGERIDRVAAERAARNELRR